MIFPKSTRPKKRQAPGNRKKMAGGADFFLKLIEKPADMSYNSADWMPRTAAESAKESEPCA